MDSWLAYALYFAAVWGFCAILAFSKITLPFREWLGARKDGASAFLLALLECPMCTGWHVGWVTVYFSIAPGPRTLLHAMTLACAVAGINFYLAVRTTGAPTA